MSVEAGRGYSYAREAAPDAPLVLGAGLLALGLLVRPSRGEGSRARKTLSLLAILAALVILLWRSLAAEDAAQAPTEEADTETETETRQAEPAADAQTEALQPQVEEVAAEEVAAEEVAAEEDVVQPAAVLEEMPVEEVPVEEATVEEATVAEVADDEVPAAQTDEAEGVEDAAELPIVEESPEFEALDAALAALIGELERVEASNAEDVRIREAQVEEREEQTAAVHAGRQLVHAGRAGDDGPHGEGDRPTEDDIFGADVEGGYAEPEPEPEPELEPEAGIELAEPAHVAEPEPVDVEPEPVDEQTAPGGLVGLIRRYSHRGERETEQPELD